jgi:hypothetical protein
MYIKGTIQSTSNKLIVIMSSSITSSSSSSTITTPNNNTYNNNNNLITRIRYSHTSFRQRRPITYYVIVFCMVLLIIHYIFFQTETPIPTTERERHPRQIDPTILTPFIPSPENRNSLNELNKLQVCTTDVTNNHVDDIKRGIKERIMWGKQPFFGWLPQDLSSIATSSREDNNNNNDNDNNNSLFLPAPRSTFMFSSSIIDNPNEMHSFSNTIQWWQKMRDWGNADKWSWFDYMGPVITPSICKIESFAKGDDEKRMCWTSAMAKEEGCVVFSIGSNNQWAFEEDIAKRTKCEIHTFDCTVKYPNPPMEIRDRVTFHSLCLSSSEFTASNGRKFIDFRGLVRAAKKKPTFLKMDIEGYEYSVLMDLISSGLKHESQTKETILPDQIAVEIHYKALPFSHEMFGRREILAYFNHLWSVGGYLLADRHDNDLCYHCSEVLLVRAVC